MTRTVSFKSMITGGVAIALSVHLWGLASTDWQEFKRALTSALLAPPAIAAEEEAAETAGATLPTAPLPAPLPTADETKVPAALPAIASLPPANSVELSVEQEMQRLLDELRALRPATEAAPSASPDVELARAALASRLDRTADRLALLQKQLDEKMKNGASTRVEKPRAMLENMKPVDAAAIAANMSIAEAAEIFSVMDERKASAVMAAMPPERAAQITLAMRSLASGQLPSLE